MDSTDSKFEYWTQTYTGQKFNAARPDPAAINIFDIAHALGNIGRFMGHTREFYSVAQHSVLVSKQCAPEDALWGLLHDATEAYVGDMPKPLKVQAIMDGYCAAEDRVTEAIQVAFNLPALPPGKHMPDSVKVADVRALFTEKRDLLLPLDWGFNVGPYKDVIVPEPPYVASTRFLDRFIELAIPEDKQGPWKQARFYMYAADDPTTKHLYSYGFAPMAATYAADKRFRSF
jgi:hypothetical protein